MGVRLRRHNLIVALVLLVSALLSSEAAEVWRNETALTSALRGAVAHPNTRQALPRQGQDTGRPSEHGWRAQAAWADPDGAFVDVPIFCLVDAPACLAAPEACPLVFPPTAPAARPAPPRGPPARSCRSRPPSLRAPPLS